ncbi:MAG: hypothetical protein R3C20_00260 [Planctomycetaceae bacterium]
MKFAPSQCETVTESSSSETGSIPQAETAIRERVYEAFKAVGLGSVCVFADLIAETRRQGIPDDEVLLVLQEDELSYSYNTANGEEIRCLRNGTGVGFLSRDSSRTIESLASASELFNELQATEQSDTTPPEDVETSPSPGTDAFDDIIAECFSEVSIDSAVMLPDLLKATRAKGLCDDDVRWHLEQSMSSRIYGRRTRNVYFGRRSASGALYLSAESCHDEGTLASISELFNAPSQPESSFILSNVLRDSGEELSEVEGLFLDAAQTLNKRFKMGRPVAINLIRRVLLRYHRTVVCGARISEALNGLVERGICERCQEGIQLTKRALWAAIVR